MGEHEFLGVRVLATRVGRFYVRVPMVFTVPRAFEGTVCRSEAVDHLNAQFCVIRKDTREPSSVAA
jgi:hypothetical protein